MTPDVSLHVRDELVVGLSPHRRSALAVDYLRHDALLSAWAQSDLTNPRPRRSILSGPVPDRVASTRPKARSLDVLRAYVSPGRAGTRRRQRPSPAPRSRHSGSSRET